MPGSPRRVPESTTVPERGLASGLHSGDPAFAGLPGYFWQRLGPTLAACSTTRWQRRRR
ncbi:MAG TPA: hypothetical protein VMA73_15695 [Streptosporangiaceae bacterium]|nr:hypothetical protein [Streptosporangiaceae bacterium]